MEDPWVLLRGMQGVASTPLGLRRCRGKKHFETAAFGKQVIEVGGSCLFPVIVE